MIPLQRQTDPPCPKCGCPQSKVVSQRDRDCRQGARQWREHVEKRRCLHCAKQFQHVETVNGHDQSDEYAVIFHVMRCPECNSDDTFVASTKRPTRYHKCRGCGHSFQSIEDR